ncbi:MAG TPA: ABC transporter ATP-binding protein [Acetobacteraceae bacterium]|nr:ABC transporter ATP-binding protein [Acetobacteraceae bacterium]
MTAPFFSVSDLVVRYDRVLAVRKVSLACEAGSAIALIGANGAGKTSTLRAITGLVRPASGEIRLEGTRIDGLPPAAIAARGITMVPEGRHVFPLMSIRDNLLMGAYLRRDPSAIRADFDRLLDRFPRLAERIHQQAGTLSGGEQEMVVVARALMARPRLLLLDEPSLGLAPKIVADIAALILSIIRDDRVSVILVEQNSRMALRLSHHAYVLETGRVALSGPSSQLAEDDHVRRLYLGASQ